MSSNKTAASLWWSWGGWMVLLYHRAAAILVVGTALLSLQGPQYRCCKELPATQGNREYGWQT